jgi:hypothetical protein
MTDKEWETALKSMNEGVKKWVNEEIVRGLARALLEHFGDEK